MSVVSTPSTLVAVRPRRTPVEELRRAVPFYMLISPTFVLLAVFNYYPALLALYRSLFVWDIGGQAEFVGLQNFQTMLRDQVFLLSLRNVALMTLAGIAAVLTVPIAVAEAIYRLGSQRAQYW